MLRAPDGRFAVDDDLALQDAGDTAVERLTAGGALLGVHESVASIAADLADDFQDAYHRAIVEGDPIVVTFAQREELRPAAVRVLGLEDVGEAAVEGLTIGRGLRGVDHAGHEAQFVDGALVIEGRLEFGAVTVVGLAHRIGVLGPAAGVRLVGEDDIGDLLRFRAGEPGVRFVEKAASAFIRGEQGTEDEAREE